VLLLPTWSIFPSRHWKSQIPFLAREYRVVTFDGRGSGRSDRPMERAAYDEWQFAADALAVLDATGTERAAIVGLSLGIQRGLILATEHPERVDGAAFIGPSYPGGGEPLAERTLYSWEDELDNDEGWATYNKHFWLRDYRSFLDFFFSRMFTEPHSTKPIDDAIGWALETSPETLVTAEYGVALQPEEAREVASRVRSPVLVIHGTDDALACQSRGVALADATGGELVLLEGSGHCPHMRDPVKVNLVLRDFIRRLE